MCQRQSFFRVNANCLSLQEGRRGSFTAVFYLQGANWDRAKEAWGCAGWWQNVGLISPSVEILGALLGSVTSLRLLFLQQTLRQECYPLTPVCCDFSLLAKCLLQVVGWGKQLQPTSDAPHIRHPKEEAAGDFPSFPAAVVSRQTGRPCPQRGALHGRAVAPRRRLVAFLLILCRKGVLGVLWLFSLDHLSAAVFNELEKK